MVKKKTEKQAQPPDKNNDAQFTIRRDETNGKIWSHVRQQWLVETPEERVRQDYLCVLANEYGFATNQIDEELEVTGRGSAQARADFVIWKTAKDKADDHNPLIVVECKSDNVTISQADYAQGDNYARLTGARFFVTHNNRETRFWRVLHDRMPKNLEEIENIPHADASDKEIEELLARLKVFKEDEFANLLHQCHNVIRNREHMDPTDAFDEIAKVLFVKVWVEREMKSKRRRENLFTAEFLDGQLGENPLNDLFKKTIEGFSEDRIFAEGERIKLKLATGREIVRLLERYNLSDTSEDIKGIAFERFLGKTFRGEIGQFFTPRSIVNFMVRMVDPKEGDIVCDPASGSGGFLIRFFEIVRQQILTDADKEYQEFKRRIAEKHKKPAKLAEELRKKYQTIQASIDQRRQGSRIWRLSNTCIYGTDANDRMARTSKMNMILHGDGHGGVHQHNGFINVNGIFEERFDIILTNPPFGANVEPSDVLTEEQIATSSEQFRRYSGEYGNLYKQAQARVAAAVGKPIASLFTLPTQGGRKLGKVKTEILFIERCLSLLKPGGRLGIVLPEGIFNNPSLAYVREFCEDRARILAVVSLPQDTFVSTGASVKASLLFLQKYREKEKADYDRKKDAAEKDTQAKYNPEIEKETTRFAAEIKAAKDTRTRRELQTQQAQYNKDTADRIAAEARALLKERFGYPIFLYEAEHVGITATGEPDTTELYEDAKLGLPPGVTADTTALSLYNAFRKNPPASTTTGVSA